MFTPEKKNKWRDMSATMPSGQHLGKIKIFTLSVIKSGLLTIINHQPVGYPLTINQ